jgi:hypothetical protein
VYSNENGDILLRLKGKRSIAQVYSTKEVINRITQYQESKATIAQLHEALKLGECIQHAHRVLIDRALEAAIFVDGGFKNGKAKIAAILVRDNGDADMRVRTVACPTSGHTEMRAVLLGYELRQEEDDMFDIPIFTDCQSILGDSMISHVDNVHWVPRARNKGADRLSNMRKKSMIAS